MDSRSRPDFKRIKAEITLLDVLERYGVRLRSKNQYERYGDCPLPQHTSDTKNTFRVKRGEKGWGWSCHASSCVEARNGRKSDGSVKKGGDVIEFVQFMEKLTSLYEAGWVIDGWISGAGSEETDRSQAPQVDALEVVEAPADVNENPRRYMAEVDEWLFELLRRRGRESWEEWQRRVGREVKKRLLASYWNGVNVGRGSDQETKGPIVHDSARYTLTDKGAEALLTRA